VQTRVADGERVQSAEAGAVADLGNPVVAARRFRRTHFTKAEAKNIATLSLYGVEMLGLIFCCVPPVIFLLLALFLVPSKLLLLVVAMMFALALWPAMSFLVSRRPASKSRTLSLLLLHWTGSFGFAFMLIILCVFTPYGSNWIVPAQMVFSIVY